MSGRGEEDCKRKEGKDNEVEHKVQNKDIAKMIVNSLEVNVVSDLPTNAGTRYVQLACSSSGPIVNNNHLRLCVLTVICLVFIDRHFFVCLQFGHADLHSCCR